ncbi:MAG TPA: helix-hairpin-helix domain-containing protein [Saprospiraceae bacterium]|nr:helix-hairpin-helix domain-containing protein [Saprospiraceae bacterium]HMP23237.1 helix-hairpin-helix domain-containing protein [Saprospiraceae bacterium]
MKTFLYEYFYYTRAERNGALALGALCILLFGAPVVFPALLPKTKSPDFALLLSHLAEEAAHPTIAAADAILFEFDPNTASKADFVALGLSPKLAQTIDNYRQKGGQFRRPEDLQRIYTLSETDYERLAPYVRIGSHAAKYAAEKRSYERPQSSAVLFDFDPNTASERDFVRLGLSAKTAANIVKYREKGGAFRKKEDFRRIYGIAEKDYHRLEPYLQIPVQEHAAEAKPVTLATVAPSPETPKRAAAMPAMIDINRATVEQWKQLPGIGAGYAQRIVNYRDKLGGFSNVEQIAETYGLPDSILQKVQPQLQASPVLRKLAINTASVEELKAHPYVNARQAAAIVSYREQHGGFISVGDVARIQALPPLLVQKLAPYLNFD